MFDVAVCLPSWVRVETMTIKTISPSSTAAEPVAMATKPLATHLVYHILHIYHIRDFLHEHWYIVITMVTGLTTDAHGESGSEVSS